MKSQQATVMDRDELLDYAKQLRDYKNLGARQTVSIIRILITSNTPFAQLQETKTGNLIQKIYKETTDDDDKELKTAALDFLNHCKKNKDLSSASKLAQKPQSANKDNNSHMNTQKNSKILKKQGSRESIATTSTSSCDKSPHKDSLDNLTLDMPLLYPDYRNQTLKLFKAALCTDYIGEAKDEIAPRVNEVVIKIESVLYQKYKLQEKSYKENMRRLKSFLSQSDNPQLRLRLLNEELSPKEFCEAETKDLVGGDYQEKLKNHETAIVESKRSDWQGSTVAEGFYACENCKSTNTSMTQQQIHSGDEPMTTFVVCKECKTTKIF